jgi:hypothetical protein
MTATRTASPAVPATDPADAAAIGRAFDVMQAAIADPTILEEIPRGATLVVLRAEDDLTTIDEQLRIAVRAARRGNNVYIRHLAPGEWAASADGEHRGENDGSASNGSN